MMSRYVHHVHHIHARGRMGHFATKDRNKRASLEYIPTCPAMQHALVVLEGPRVKGMCRRSVMFLTVLVPLKLLWFFVGLR